MSTKKQLGSFYEDFTVKPPEDIMWFKPVIKTERLWLGYIVPIKPVIYIFCPYKVGSHIPEEVVKIKAVRKAGIWKWLVTCKIENS